MMIERLSDACAENEFGDLCISAADALAQLAALLRAKLGKPALATK